LLYAGFWHMAKVKPPEDEAADKKPGANKRSRKEER
jgi:hypothetical protein